MLLWIEKCRSHSSTCGSQAFTQSFQLLPHTLIRTRVLFPIRNTATRQVATGHFSSRSLQLEINSVACVFSPLACRTQQHWKLQVSISRKYFIAWAYTLNASLLTAEIGKNTTDLFLHWTSHCTWPFSQRIENYRSWIECWNIETLGTLMLRTKETISSQCSWAHNRKELADTELTLSRFVSRRNGWVLIALPIAPYCENVFFFFFIWPQLRTTRAKISLNYSSFTFTTNLRRLVLQV